MQGRSREDGHECWVAIAGFKYAKELLAAKPVSVDGKYNPQTDNYLQGLQPAVLQEFLSVLPQLGAQDVPEPSFTGMQRWGAGFVEKPVGKEVLSSDSEHIVACGDFCLGSTFESAALSGIRAAEKVRGWNG